MSGNDKSDPQFAGLVLAGGRSSRMGRDKAFLTVNGERMIDRQLRLLREAGAKDLFVSGRRGVNYRVPGATVLLDKIESAGPAAGITAAMQVCDREFLMVLAVDLPALPVSALRELRRRVRAGRGVVPVHDRGYEPLVAIYPVAIAAEWDRHLRNGERSLQFLVQSALDCGFVSRRDIPARERDAFANWNSPSDWSFGGDH